VVEIWAAARCRPGFDRDTETDEIKSNPLERQFRRRP